MRAQFQTPHSLQQVFKGALAWTFYLMTSVCASASSEELSFDIPSGPLAATLLEIARVSGALVSFRPTLVDQRTAPPIRGRLTLRQALDLATQPSGLSIDITPGGVVTVQANEADPVPPPSEEARHDIAEPVQATLPPVVIRGSGTPPQEDGLQALRSWSATRTDTPLSELPQSVAVVTSEALALQGALDSNDSLRYVPGMTLRTSSTELGTRLSALVRGLSAQYALSGMRTNRGGSALDAVFIERIEVTRGPSSVMGGVSSDGGRGGGVNLVRKEAGPNSHTEVAQSISSQDSGTLRLSADLGGDVASRTFWRLIGQGSLSGTTEGGYTRQHGGGLLFSLVHQQSDWRAALTLQADQHRITPAAASRGGEPDPEAEGGLRPLERGVAPPRNPGDRLLSRYADAELSLEWRFSPRWRVDWKGRAQQASLDERRDRAKTLGQASYRHFSRGLGMQAGLTGHVDTGPFQHTLLLGADLDTERSSVTEPYDGEYFSSTATRTQTGLLLQDQIRWGPWRARLAAQRSHTPVDFVFYNATAINWDAGLLYQWRPEVAVYAGTQRLLDSDEIQSDLRLADGTSVPYRVVRQLQAGVKFKLLDERLSMTWEAYRMNQDHVLAHYDPDPVGPKDYPGRDVNGLDIDIAGRIVPSLHATLGLSLMQARDTSSPDATEIFKVRARGVPARTLSLLTRYDLPGHEAGTARLGLAFRAFSSSLAVGSFPDEEVPDYRLRLPGGAQLDMTWERRLGPWSIAASVNNVFNRQLYGTQAEPDYIPLLPKRNFRLTATFRD